MPIQKLVHYLGNKDEENLATFSEEMTQTLFARFKEIPSNNSVSLNVLAFNPWKAKKTSFEIDCVDDIVTLLEDGTIIINNTLLYQIDNYEPIRAYLSFYHGEDLNLFVRDLFLTREEEENFRKNLTIDEEHFDYVMESMRFLTDNQYSDEEVETRLQQDDLFKCVYCSDNFDISLEEIKENILKEPLIQRISKEGINRLSETHIQLNQGILTLTFFFSEFIVDARSFERLRKGYKCIRKNGLKLTLTFDLDHEFYQQFRAIEKQFSGLLHFSEEYEEELPSIHDCLFHGLTFSYLNDFIHRYYQKKYKPNVASLPLTQEFVKKVSECYFEIKMLKRDEHYRERLENILKEIKPFPFVHSNYFGKQNFEKMLNNILSKGYTSKHLTNNLQREEVNKYLREIKIETTIEELVDKSFAQTLHILKLPMNKTIIKLAHQEFFNLFSICLLKNHGFSLKEINLILDTQDVMFFKLKRILESEWFQEMQRFKTSKSIAKDFYFMQKENKKSYGFVYNTLLDIDKQYQNLLKLTGNRLSQLKTTINYRLNFFNFEKHLIDLVGLHQSEIDQQPFQFKQMNILNGLTQEDRILYQEGDYQLYAPFNPFELKQFGQRYKMCFGTYVNEILGEKMFIFFIKDLNEKFCGAVRVENNHSTYRVVEVKNKNNRVSEELQKWTRKMAIHQNYYMN